MRDFDGVAEEIATVNALQAQVETLTEERDSANRRLGRQIQDTQDRITALQQQVSALREAMKEAMDELYPATGYRAMNAFGILNATLAPPSPEPSPEVMP